MKGRLVQIFETLRASYWFIPSVMALAASLLAEAAIRVEGMLPLSDLQASGWLYAYQPEGARSMLSTVAGSMITVAGVTFSMTILALSHASSQIGPRLFTDFMRDRGNQVTLGTFIATFIYCLLVLRTVHGADPSGAEDSLEAFVPQLAVLLALLLAILSVGVLIYFIHHVPAMLSMSNLIERVGNTLQDRIVCLYPSGVAESGSQEEPGVPKALGTPTDALRADDRIGYLCYLDEEALLAWSCEADLVVEIVRRPGEFVSPGTLLANVHGSGKLEDDVRSGLIASFATGPERTPRQDVLFPALEMVEVAVRALSPGINDPYTAVRCIDQLRAALVAFGQRELPSARREDDEGRLRVLARPVDFETFCDTILDGLRPHVARDANCSVHLLEAIAETVPLLAREADRGVLRKHAEALRGVAEAASEDPRDRTRIGAAAARAAAAS